MRDRQTYPEGYGVEDRESVKRAWEEEFGISGHPKADLLFNLAWEFGHSHGYNDVYSYYIDMVDLIKD
jgi:hypothetical protein